MSLADLPRAAAALASTWRRARAPLAAFAAMGLLWGMWSALIPQVQAAVGADDAQLGRAFLCVAAGALPAMLLGRRLVDRFGARLLAPSVALFGLAGALPGEAASPPALAAALLLLGAASGFMDVVMNARVSASEAAHGSRLMHLAHGVYALVFFVAATATGLARGEGLPHGTLLAAAGIATLALAIIAREPAATIAPDRGLLEARHQPRRLTQAVVLLGLVAFIALLAETGLQAWSALHLERTLAAGAAVGGLGPGLLGLAVAVGRFAAQGLVQRIGDGPLLAGGGVLGAAGSLGFALAPGQAAGLAGLALAGAGISILVPTALGLAGREARRRRGNHDHHRLPRPVRRSGNPGQRGGAARSRRCHPDDRRPAPRGAGARVRARARRQS